MCSAIFEGQEDSNESLKSVIELVTSSEFSDLDWKSVTFNVDRAFIHVHRNSTKSKDSFDIKYHKCYESKCPHSLCNDEKCFFNKTPDEKPEAEKIVEFLKKAFPETETVSVKTEMKNSLMNEFKNAISEAVEKVMLEKDTQKQFKIYEVQDCSKCIEKRKKSEDLKERVKLYERCMTRGCGDLGSKTRMATPIRKGPRKFRKLVTSEKISDLSLLDDGEFSEDKNRKMRKCRKTSQFYKFPYTARHESSLKTRRGNDCRFTLSSDGSKSFDVVWDSDESLRTKDFNKNVEFEKNKKFHDTVSIKASQRKKVSKTKKRFEK